MPNFHLAYKNKSYPLFTNHYASQLNPVTNVTDIEVAEKLFAAQYITENITKTERILNSAAFDSVKEEYQNLLYTMIQEYHTLSAHDFLAAHNFYVIDTEQTKTQGETNEC